MVSEAPPLRVACLNNAAIVRLKQREWEKARNDFFEAFKNYDEAGVQRRIGS